MALVPDPKISGTSKEMARAERVELCRVAALLDGAGSGLSRAQKDLRAVLQPFQFEYLKAAEVSTLLRVVIDVEAALKYLGTIERRVKSALECKP